MAEEEASKALWAKCESCGHCWAVAYYPMELGKFARMAKRHSRCPKCDSPGAIAKQDNGELLEQAHG